jgi:hypothetical protein
MGGNAAVKYERLHYLLVIRPAAGRPEVLFLFSALGCTHTVMSVINDGR